MVSACRRVSSDSRRLSTRWSANVHGSANPNAVAASAAAASALICDAGIRRPAAPADTARSGTVPAAPWLASNALGRTPAAGDPPPMEWTPLTPTATSFLLGERRRSCIIDSDRIETDTCGGLGGCRHTGLRLGPVAFVGSRPGLTLSGDGCPSSPPPSSSAASFSSSGASCRPSSPSTRPDVSTCRYHVPHISDVESGVTCNVKSSCAQETVRN
mmetsp:Transcript_8192/g.16151  ORF Transcript_8192/g.16151 Transcript_8192/m.16151 type:complete len:215 (+) Transcript_8192:364-1008(+)